MSDTEYPEYLHPYLPAYVRMMGYDLPDDFHITDIQIEGDEVTIDGWALANSPHVRSFAVITDWEET